MVLSCIDTLEVILSVLFWTLMTESQWGPFAPEKVAAGLLTKLMWDTNGYIMDAAI